MANVTAQAQPHQTNAETERLATLVRELQDECARLREALATVEAERNGYLKAIYENARASREFEDVDIASLEADSAGPVEMLQ